MFKKILFVSLVLFGLLFSQMASECFADPASQLEQAQTYQKNGDYEQAKAIYQDIITNYPGTDYAFKAQSNLVIVYILMEKYSQAQKTLDKLFSDFAGHQDVPISLFRIARRYEIADKHDSVKNLYQQVIQRYPGTLQASKSGIHLAKLNIEPLIESGDEAAAQTAIDKFSADFAGHKDLPKLLYSIARIYEKRGDEYKGPGGYEQAKNLYQQLIQQHPDSLHAGKAQFRASKTNALSLSESGNYAATQSALGQLTATFSGHWELPSVFYLVAMRYEDQSEYEKAQSTYQQIIAQYPDNVHASRAQVALAGLNIFSLIDSGDDTAAQAAFSQLTADYSGHSNLPFIVYRVAYRYYKKAGQLESQGLIDQSKGYFQKAVATWEVMINGLPGIYDTPHACYYAAECYSKLGQPEKMISFYQKVVVDYPAHSLAWDALFRVGHSYEEQKESGAISESEADLKIKAAYEELLEEYPTCGAARYARRWLSQHSAN